MINSTHLTSKPAKILAGGAMLGVGALCLASFTAEADAYRLATADPAKLSVEKLQSLPAGKPASYYTAVADAALALQRPNYTLAEQATLQVLQNEGGNASTWNRLAFIDLRKNRQLTRDGVAALYKSYETSPYGDLSVMIWRVEFASSVWSSLPDDLREKTLDQIPVIGRFGISWDWRTRACKENPHRDIYEAACAIAPGVNRPGNQPD